MKKVWLLSIYAVLAIGLFACQKSWQVDYLVLVNQENKLPDDWEDNMQSHMVEVQNVIHGDDRYFKVEKETYEHFEALRSALLEEGIDIEIDSATRTVKEQEELSHRFEEEYGEDYVKKYVAVPGYSEHHTGLVIDICIVKDGTVIDDNEAMIAETKINETIVSKLADYGFILRYPKGKEAITGYSYESWHFRFVGSKQTAHKIMDSGLTLEEYLGKA